MFNRNTYYELSEEIRKRIVKCYILYIILFSTVGLIVSNILPIIKENYLMTIGVTIISLLIGLLIADEKSKEFQIKEQEMKWKIEIYDTINKIEKK